MDVMFRQGDVLVLRVEGDAGELVVDRLLPHTLYVARLPPPRLARLRMVIGTAFHPGYRLIHVLDFPYPDAGNQLAGGGERKDRR